jgi:hypothetical protein
MQHGYAQRLGAIFITILLIGNLLPAGASPDAYRTPRAGEAFSTELWGEPVTVPERNRTHINAFSLGGMWSPDGPSGYGFVPFGSLFFWRNLDDGRKRFRGEIAGVFNDLRANFAPASWDGLEAVLTFSNLIIPYERVESVEGQRQRDVDLRWYWARAGIGLGYRTPLAPGHQDNALELALTYEPGYLWFDRANDTAPNFVVPQDTYEGLVHLRLRADALERNLLELPQHGFATGFDLIYGHRANWQTWGGPVFGTFEGDNYDDWSAASAYAVVAGGVPFVGSERHQLVGSAYGGFGADLDRFSAFRLPGRPTGSEWEVLSKPILPGASFQEFFPRSYAIFEMLYRYEALFFLYPYLRGTYAWVDRPRFEAGGTVGNRMDALSSLGGGVVSGAPLDSQIEIDYAFNFGILRDYDGRPEFGGHSVFVLWSKEF